jgi:hypothetical protein
MFASSIANLFQNGVSVASHFGGKVHRKEKKRLSRRPEAAGPEMSHSPTLALFGLFELSETLLFIVV